MNTIWTPSGEHPIPPKDTAQVKTDKETSRPTEQAGEQPPQAVTGQPTPEELQNNLKELSQQLAKTDAEVVIANHCYGLFELASLYLSSKPPQLDKAKLAIDAFTCLIEGSPNGMSGNLGMQEDDLKEALKQIRLAYVQLSQLK
ncbi:MAG: hypothetical protein M1483_05335 [Actinobacteria bacterium]|nr:hypothetical protein [Actinomycetota bacterium]MCL6105036.1 hypothetical protein [Actinomycetota bacterium]